MRRTHALIALGLLLVLAGIRVAVGQNLAITEVDIVDFAYQPPEGVSSVGSSVTWTNTGSFNHTVTFDSGQGSSGTLAPGDTFTFTFPSMGRYSYHCTFHPSMTGYVDALPPVSFFTRTWIPLTTN
ncbi:MAG TPA: plastocyanin/azurin family copper-binding protein [Herpetosiphonaceae bacterium]